MKPTATSRSRALRGKGQPLPRRQTNGNGHSNQKANGHSNGTKAVAPLASTPHYDDGGRYDSGLRYAVTDTPSPPAPSLQSKVKLDLKLRTDADLMAFVNRHITMITGNTDFPSPQPLPADLAAALADFEDRLAQQTQALAQAKVATTAKDYARKLLEDLMVARGAYVQTTSGGNGVLIESTGLEIKNPPSPVGVLLPPENIRIELNGSPGMMKLRWDPVPRSRGYLVQCSEDVQPREWSQVKNSGKASLELQNMEVGKTYVFRIATSGGSSGQSDWSPEVKRGAA